MQLAINTPFVRNSPRYGITEKKRAEIDALALDVLDAQNETEVFQAIVTSLTLKYNDFQSLLSAADNNRSLALNNVNLKNQLLQSALDLKNNSDIVFNNMALANARSKALATNLGTLMDKLIYVVEMINRLSNLIIMKKALNPLISDELVSIVGTAGNDANNAIAVTLIALKSTFAAQATNMETLAAITLEKIQAEELYDSLGTIKNESAVIAEEEDNISTDEKDHLSALIDEAYKNSKDNYDHMHKATTAVSRQLSQATIKLNESQIRLKSLQAGLAAANAAAQAA